MQYPSKSQLNSSQTQKEHFSNASATTTKKPRIAKIVLKSERTSGAIRIPDIKQYYRAILLNTKWYWYSDRQVDQWNRIEDLEMNPQNYGYLIFDKGAESIQWKKDSVFNKWCWFNWRSACKRMQIDPFLSPCTNLKSKWIQKLNIRPDTMTVKENNLGKTLEDMGTGENFLNRTPIACALRSRIDKQDLITLQSFYKAKDTVKRTKFQPTNWEKDLNQHYIPQTPYILFIQRTQERRVQRAK